MITIITGTPGAGKTLYTISKLLQPLVGSSITYTDSTTGQEVTAPRTVYTNINGLLLDHELIDGGDNKGLRDWHTWAQPGSVIVFDEVQRHWQPRPNGAKVPDDIAALETHRHMGVDFILITQNVLLVDRNIHALAGRHLHIRRMANTHMAIVYEWDHVSRGLLYAKSLNKAPWRYSSKVFKLYKSAEAHTKQPRRIPGLVWIVGLAAVALGVLTPTVYARLGERIGGSTAQAEAKKTPASGIGARQTAPAPLVQAQAPAPAIVASAPAAAASTPAITFAGCIAIKNRCSCYDTKGNQVDRELEICEASTAPPKVVLAGGTFPDPAPYVPHIEPAKGVARTVPTPEVRPQQPDQINQSQLMAEMRARYPAKASFGTGWGYNSVRN